MLILQIIDLFYLLVRICCKTLEHIIYLSIFSYSEKHNLLSDKQQHGFYAKRSCETQLLGAINDFQLCLNRCGHIDELFLDFARELILIR